MSDEGKVEDGMDAEAEGEVEGGIERWARGLSASTWAAAVAFVLVVGLLVAVLVNPGRRVGPVAPARPPVGGEPLPPPAPAVPPVVRAGG